MVAYRAYLGWRFDSFSYSQYATFGLSGLIGAMITSVLLVFPYPIIFGVAILLAVRLRRPMVSLVLLALFVALSMGLGAWHLYFLTLVIVGFPVRALPTDALALGTLQLFAILPGAFYALKGIRKLASQKEGS